MLPSSFGTTCFNKIVPPKELVLNLIKQDGIRCNNLQIISSFN